MMIAVILDIGTEQLWAQSNLGFKSRCDLKIFKMAIESNSKFLCCSDASNQVSAQSHLLFGRCCLSFKIAVLAANLDISME